MESYTELLKANQEWAADKLAVDPNFFLNLADIQNPEFLWIGCSDSRVPANEITRTNPGEIFVHRNIANLVVHTDVNLLSVLEYAVMHLKVKHIIVCGHYGCGGVKAAMGNGDFNQVLNMWLRVIKDVYRHNREELDSIADLDQRADRLVELNVKEQVEKLCKTSTIQKAWKERNAPIIHGWVYGLKNGILHEINTIKPDLSVLNPIYVYDNI
ncbi:MAG TPA: carbonic anhydrase [Niabella sp.]|nr:carbonic anhydrase [Niabella sp.]HOZ96573.1 carbonic anhydrase [Niabella sp.]HQW13246.1 carbonic anhydrase [Niabella sp.]HQX18714.1 carbonic anhydrase [Niabella sp.]HQX41854.1 carbonic anhydrase [Niabella sp.]